MNGGAQQTYTGPFSLSDGTNVVTYWSVDVAGNVEPFHSGYANIDTVAPTSAIAGPHGPWSNVPTMLSISAVDDTSHVATIQYRRWVKANWEKDWTTYTSPFALKEGFHFYQYRATDRAGNVELSNQVGLGVDTHPPVTRAYPAAVKKGGWVWLSYEVWDPAPGCGDAYVTLKIYKAKQLRKSINLGSTIVNAKLQFRWHCKLARGTYVIRVYAEDDAGNVQARAGSARLTVR